MELEVVPLPGSDLALPATLSLPATPRAGLVVLHGAEAGSRDFFLYEHLAELLAEEDVAVLRFDRRPSSDGHDVPLQMQAEDALAALRLLRGHVGDVPLGLWGFSQGAWVAPLASVTEPELVDFVICVSASGVSPAEQMRDGCAKQLRKHGFTDDDVAEMEATRISFEEYLRTGARGAAAQAALDRAAGRPWFAHTYLPATLPQPGAWRDMDFQPQPVLDALICPVLAFYGEEDEWVPVDRSIEAWNHAQAVGSLSDLMIVRLPGTGHLPTVGGVAEASRISNRYSDDLPRWVRKLGTPSSH